METFEGECFKPDTNESESLSPSCQEDIDLGVLSGTIESSEMRSKTFIKMIDDENLKSLCDLILVVQGEKCYTHRAVLAGASPVFASMFTNGMKESNPTEYPQKIVLHDSSFRSVEQSLRFLYHGKASVESSEHAVEILDFAHKYQFDELLETLGMFLMESVCMENALELWNCGDQCGLVELCNVCFKRIEAFFEEVYLTLNFEECTLELFERLLNSQNMVVISELTLLNAIILWINANETERRKEFEKLLKYIQVERMTPPELIEAGKIALNFEAARDFSVAILNVVLKNGSGTTFWNVLKDRSYLMRCRRDEKSMTVIHRLTGVDHAIRIWHAPRYIRSESVEGGWYRCPWNNARLQFELVFRMTSRLEKEVSLMLYLQSGEVKDLEDAFSSIAYSIFVMSNKGEVKVLQSRSIGALRKSDRPSSCDSDEAEYSMKCFIDVDYMQNAAELYDDGSDFLLGANIVLPSVT